MHFLGTGAVDARLSSIDFATFVAAWLNDHQAQLDLARFVLHLLPEGSRPSASRHEDVLHPSHRQPDRAARPGAARRRHLARLHEGWPAPGAAERSSVAVHSALHSPETLAAIRDKIRWAADLLLYRADKYVLNKIVASATSFFDDDAQ